MRTLGRVRGITRNGVRIDLRGVSRVVVLWRRSCGITVSHPAIFVGVQGSGRSSNPRISTGSVMDDVTVTRPSTVGWSWRTLTKTQDVVRLVSAYDGDLVVYRGYSPYVLV